MFKGKRKSKGKRALIVTDVDPVQPKFRVANYRLLTIVSKTQLQAGS